MNQLPHSIESEQSVLGAIMTHGKQESVVRQILDVVTVDMFYNSEHQNMFACLTQGDHVDVSMMLTLAKENKGFYTDSVVTIGQAYTSKASVLSHANKIAETFTQRRLINLAHVMYEKSAKQQSSETIQEFSDLLAEIDAPSAYEPRHIREGLSEYHEILQHRNKNDERYTGIKTGISSLDNDISGLGQNWLVVLAGRPSNGKSLVAQMIYEYIAHTKPTMFFSLEMAEIEILDRTLCLSTGIDPKDLRNGQADEIQWARASEVIKKLSSDKYHAYIDTTPALTLNQICARAKAFKRKFPNAGLIEIDYLGLMQKNKSERNDIAIGEITRGLKQLAKEIQVPIVLLVQCSRAADTAQRLQMSHLADSASIERDADLVLFTHKEDSVNPDTSKKGIIELTAGKFRHGSLPNDIYLKKQEIGFKCLDPSEITKLKTDAASQKKKGYKL